MTFLLRSVGQVLIGVGVGIKTSHFFLFNHFLFELIEDVLAQAATSPFERFQS
jgi:hypothetical protein